METEQDPREPVLLIAFMIVLHANLFLSTTLFLNCVDVKKGTDTHCVLRETGQMPIFLYWFRCIVPF